MDTIRKQRRILAAANVIDGSMSQFEDGTLSCYDIAALVLESADMEVPITAFPLVNSETGCTFETIIDAVRYGEVFGALQLAEARGDFKLPDLSLYIHNYEFDPLGAHGEGLTIWNNEHEIPIVKIQGCTFNYMSKPGIYTAFSIIRLIKMAIEEYHGR